MKSKYDKYIKETWAMKDKVYNDYKRSGLKSFSKFVKKEIKNLKPIYRKNKVSHTMKSFP
jgi:hypothetical protein